MMCNMIIYSLIYKKDQIIKILTKLFSKEKFLLTIQLTKLSDFISGSGEFLSPFGCFGLQCVAFHVQNCFEIILTIQIYSKT